MEFSVFLLFFASHLNGDKLLMKQDKLHLTYFFPLRPDFTSNLVHGLAFRTPKFYIAPYGKINHGLSCNCDMKSGLRVHRKN